MYDPESNTSITAAAVNQQTESLGVNTPLTSSGTASNNYNHEIISDEIRKLFEIMNYVVLSGTVSFIGSVCNIVNVVVFIKQGLTEPVNISLLGLSLSDLGALVTLVWMSVCFNPLFANSGIGFDSVRVQYLTAGWPHVCFARITSWITAFITFERCLCISMPLKVKTIITPKRTTCTIVCIFAAMLSSTCPVYYAIRLGTVYDFSTNTTLTSLVYRSNGIQIENMSFAINFAAQLSSFVLVIVCTVILVQTLRRKSRWRKHSANKDTVTQRDKRLIKMIISLSIVFIICFLPSAVNLVVMMLIPEYSITGTQAVSDCLLASMFFRDMGWSLGTFMVAYPKHGEAGIPEKVQYFRGVTVRNEHRLTQSVFEVSLHESTGVCYQCNTILGSGGGGGAMNKAGNQTSNIFICGLVKL
ncbi:unnamed protein product [Candidula unifasciata]|uniref:G-protein coupled receptors family 1 profile domain-containing protein n=1 Tax=Candidula unifasciata TaxID=100452 RepID=A0A8S3ZHF3_9EUPU|nr:unnamed protein product [Candidula unifasciata]